MIPIPAGQTQYDLNFRIFGIPVRVHPLFWLIALLLGFQTGRLGLTATWVGCLFVSILIHELGHAFAARHYGWPPHIVLYSFGGLAMFQPTYGYTRGRAIWISFAGPLAGFILFGVVAGFEFALVEGVKANQAWAQALLRGNFGTGIAFAIIQLKYINLFWGLVNLLPIHPLDGGRIFSEIANARGSVVGRRRTHVIGMVAAGLVAAYFLNSGRFFGGLLFGSLAYENYRQWDQLRRGAY